ncbi:MAG: hypothetical protein N2441_03955 [Rhodocyclaceae bacterium]|nr:hypothetical protein [Rhodocyclaceae bacterium]
MRCCVGWVILVCMAVGSAMAQMRPVDVGDDPARAVAGRDLAPDDGLVTQARAWLKKIAEATGETEEQVAAAAIKLNRFLYDALRVRAMPMEALEGMASLAGPGKTLSDLTRGYFEARRDSADKSHAATMSLLIQRRQSP